jgi:hypothetical protein
VFTLRQVPELLPPPLSVEMSDAITEQARAGCWLATLC